MIGVVGGAVIDVVESVLFFESAVVDVVVVLVVDSVVEVVEVVIVEFVISDTVVDGDAVMVVDDDVSFCPVTIVAKGEIITDHIQ